MSFPRQLPLPTIPATLEPSLTRYLQDLHARLRSWIDEAATQLGALQSVPVRNQIPTTGQVLVFDGEAYAPGFTAVPLIGARNGVNTNFTIAVGTITLRADGTPLMEIYQGGQPLTYVTTPPAAGQWTLSGQTIVLGTPPDSFAATEPIVAFVVVG